MYNSWTTGIEKISKDYKESFTRQMKADYENSLKKQKPKKEDKADKESKTLKGNKEVLKTAKPVAFELGKADIKKMNENIVQITQFIGERLQNTAMSEFKESFQRQYGDNVKLSSLSDALAFGTKGGSPFYAVDDKKIEFEAKPDDIANFNAFKAKESKDVWGINRVNYEFEDYTPGQYDSGFKDYSARKNSEVYSLHNQIWRDGGFQPVKTTINKTTKFIDDDFNKEYEHSIKKYVANKTGILLG